MVATCCAYNCKRRSSKDSEVTFHRFPFTRPDMVAKWIHALRWKNWKPTKNTVVCSLHFKPQCFKMNNDRRYLHSNSVPTIFDFPQPRVSRPPQSPRPPPTQRGTTAKPTPTNSSTVISSSSAASTTKTWMKDHPVQTKNHQEVSEMDFSKLLAHDHNYILPSQRMLAKQVILLSNRLVLANDKLVTARRKLHRRAQKIESQERLIRELRHKLYGKRPVIDDHV